MIKIIAKPYCCTLEKLKIFLAVNKYIPSPIYTIDIAKPRIADKDNLMPFLGLGLLSQPPGCLTTGKHYFSRVMVLSRIQPP